MSRLTQDASIDRLAEPKEQARYISMFFDQLVRILNNGITFGDNFDAKILNVSFSSATTNQTVSHGLGRVPAGYLVIGRSADIRVYNGTAAWTTSALYLASSGSGSVKLIIF